MTTKPNPSIITIIILPTVLAGVLLLSGCDSSGGSGNVTIDAPALAGALKFLGVCSIICSLIWAVSLVFGSNRYEESLHRETKS